LKDEEVFEEVIILSYDVTKLKMAGAMKYSNGCPSSAVSSIYLAGRDSLCPHYTSRFARCHMLAHGIDQNTLDGLYMALNFFREHTFEANYIVVWSPLTNY